MKVLLALADIRGVSRRVRAPGGLQVLPGLAVAVALRSRQRSQYACPAHRCASSKDWTRPFGRVRSNQLRCSPPTRHFGRVVTRSDGCGNVGGHVCSLYHAERPSGELQDSPKNRDRRGRHTEWLVAHPRTIVVPPWGV